MTTCLILCLGANSANMAVKFGNDTWLTSKKIKLQVYILNCILNLPPNTRLQTTTYNENNKHYFLRSDDMSLLSIVVAKIESRSSVNGQFVIVYTCKPHINHKYSVVIISIASSKMLVFSVLKGCISADEKDRDSMFTTVTTIRKPGCVSNKTQQLHGVFSHRDGAARIHMMLHLIYFIVLIN